MIRREGCCTWDTFLTEISFKRMATNMSERTEVRNNCENRIGGNLANGHTVNASEQETLFSEEHPVILGDICESKPEGNKQTQSGLLHRCRWYFGNSSKWKLSTIVLSVLLGISVTINIGLWAKLRQIPAAPSPPDASSDSSPCPQHWLMNEGRCYFFSETEATWNASRINCSSQGASLLAMETPQEREFVLGSQRHTYFWLDFWRGGTGEPWKRADGSPLSNTFPIRGEGLCAYMNEKNASSTWCENKRHWICTKPILGH